MLLSIQTMKDRSYSSDASITSWVAAIKVVFNGLSSLIVLPCVMASRIACYFVGAERGFPGWSQAFALVPGLAGIYLRRGFYRATLLRCGADAQISFGTVFSNSTAEIGRGVYVGVYGCLGGVTLEDDVLIASHVSITNGAAQHGIDRLDIPIRDQPGIRPRVTIGEGSWVGERTVVMADIGKHCVIGAGSVVTKPIPDFAIAVGVPARVVRFRGRLNPSDAKTIEPAKVIPGV